MWSLWMSLERTLSSSAILIFMRGKAGMDAGVSLRPRSLSEIPKATLVSTKGTRSTGFRPRAPKNRSLGIIATEDNDWNLLVLDQGFHQVHGGGRIRGVSVCPDLFGVF